MSTHAMEELLNGVRAERDRLLAEIEALNVELTARRDEVKKYERVLNAADPTPPKRTRTKAAASRNGSHTWDVSDEKTNEIFAAMHEADESTIQGLVDTTGISQPTVSKALVRLHSEGRIRLLRMERNSKVWDVIR